MPTGSIARGMITIPDSVLNKHATYGYLTKDDFKNRICDKVEMLISYPDRFIGPKIEWRPERLPEREVASAIPDPASKTIGPVVYTRDRCTGPGTRWKLLDTSYRTVRGIFGQSSWYLVRLLVQVDQSPHGVEHVLVCDYREVPPKDQLPRRPR